jgi:hypothetical protein
MGGVRGRQTRRAYSSRWLTKVVRILPPGSLVAQGSGQPVCNVTSFNVPSNVGGCSPSGGWVRYPFNMDATFGSGTGYACEKCEYRQYIYGYFKARASSSAPWTDYPSQVYGGGNLSGSFQEDGCSGGTARYGHRSDATACAESYSPTRATGCTYSGTDAPGMTAPSGWLYDFTVVFMGQIVNVDTGNVIQSNTWTAACAGTF